MQFYRVTVRTHGNRPHTFYVEVENEEALHEITSERIESHRPIMIEIVSEPISQADYIHATRPGE